MTSKDIELGKLSAYLSKCQGKVENLYLSLSFKESYIPESGLEGKKKVKDIIEKLVLLCYFIFL